MNPLLPRLREVQTLLAAKLPLHPDGPAYPGPDNDLSTADFQHAVLRYDAYAIGVLSSLLDAAAAELERRP